MKKRPFLNNVGLFLSAREKVLNNFKSRIFSIKDKIPTSQHEPTPETTPEPAPEPALELAREPSPKPAPKSTLNPKVFDTPKNKRKILRLKSRDKYLNEIKNEEKNINNQIFKENFNCPDSTFLKKELSEDNQIKNIKTVKHLNKSLIDLRSSDDSKKNSENENPNKIIDNLEKNHQLE